MDEKNNCYILHSPTSSVLLVSFMLNNPLETIYERGEELDSFQDLEMGSIHILINDKRISKRVISDSDERDEWG